MSGTELTCTATASDLNDGDISSNVTFAWTNQDSTELGSESTLLLTDENSNTGDEITCTSTVVDSDEGTATNAAMVVLENSAPTLDSITITPNSGVKTNTELRI